MVCVGVTWGVASAFPEAWFGFPDTVSRTAISATTARAAITPIRRSLALREGRGLVERAPCRSADGQYRA